MHTYKYPGTYTVTFAYYRPPYDTKPFLFQSQEQVVISPTISLNVVSNKGFEFVNSGTTSVDLSGWVIVLSDTIVELPPFTIIPSKKTVLMPFSAFGLERKDYARATLQTPQRIAVGNTEATKSSVASSSGQILYAKATSSEASLDSSIFAASAINALSNTSEEPKIKSRTKTIVFAAVLIIVIALFLMLERFIRLRQEG